MRGSVTVRGSWNRLRVLHGPIYNCTADDCKNQPIGRFLTGVSEPEIIVQAICNRDYWKLYDAQSGSIGSEDDFSRRSKAVVFNGGNEGFHKEFPTHLVVMHRASYELPKFRGGPRSEGFEIAGGPVQ